MKNATLTIALIVFTAPQGERAAVAPGGWGQQYYVATTGDDASPGTIDRPWRTIQMAMTSATPGSTVNIRGGTYNERLTVNVSGTAGNYITFQPYGFSVPAGGCGGYTGVACGGEQVILDYAYLGVVTDGVPFLAVSGQSFIRIQGITFQNFTAREVNSIYNQGVRVDGSSSFVELAYDRFLNNRDTGPHDGTSALVHIRIWGPASNVRFYGNEIANVVTNYSEALTAYGTTQHDFVAENNWIHDTDAGAIDAQGGAHDYTIRANKLEYISKKRSDGTFWYGNPNVAIYTDGANTGLIERNFISDAGIGIEVLAEPGEPSAHDVIIRNNVVQRSGGAIVIGTWYSDVDGSTVYDLSVLDNTFYGNGAGVIIRPMVSATVAWKNNIIAGNGMNYVNTLGWNPGDAAYNLYWGSGTGPGAQIVADPLFTNPALGDFTLQRGSPAIDAGDPAGSSDSSGTVDFRGLPRFVNGRLDIGACEAQ